MAFSFKKQDIKDIICIEPEVYPDARGLFTEIYRGDEYKEGGISDSFVQLNLSESKENVLRGLHYQLEPKAQAKLVCAVRGIVFDVAVDIRVGSPTFGRWVSVELSGETRNLVYIPRGFAHGFCALSKKATVMYYVSEFYAPEQDRGLRWDDEKVGIEWPVKDPIVSDKDKAHPGLDEIDNNFRYGRGNS